MQKGGRACQLRANSLSRGSSAAAQKFMAVFVLYRRDEGRGTKDPAEMIGRNRGWLRILQARWGLLRAPAVPITAPR